MSDQSVTVHARDLDTFCVRVDELGGLHHPTTVEAMKGFQYIPSVKIDLSLDPFSETYFRQQIALYEELSGRSFDIQSGEQHNFDVASRINAANPYGSPNSHFIAMHGKAIFSMLETAKLPVRPRILDLGCGWGLSSELLAFAGASVTAVDINPLFCKLVESRAKRLGLDITSSVGNFEDFQGLRRDHDMAFFYECLHHAPRPLKVLRHTARFLKPNGVIAFAGEPINAPFWPDWGMRLDYISVYVIRKHGWFESGWSARFLRQCFDRAGFALEVHPKIGLRGGPIGIARRKPG
jgi:2-polyprenyl-3-methyl-5-hydroxy-6-metoxy-1,4-benzoquinol methylase